MIRINLVPARKKKVRSGGPSIPAGTAHWWLIGMLLLWGGLAGAGTWFVMLETSEADKFRRDHSTLKGQADDIRKDIKEDQLSARKEQVERMEVAIKKLKAKRRTPVYIMYELSMILTDRAEGGGPDIDQEKYRQNLKEDPRNEVNDRWDTSGLWILSASETSGVLAIDGEARDATDLAEFTRRLRASARFGKLTKSVWKRLEKAEGEPGGRISWEIEVAIRRWN